MSGSGAPLITDATPAHTEWRPRESALTAGVAVVDITPPVGIRAHNWGAARIGHATGVHRPLTASALAITDDTGTRWVLTVDLGWWHSVAVFSSVFDPLAAALGVTDDRLLLHLVHTHAGPSLAEGGLDLPGSELVEPYRVALVDALIAACRTAAAEATPAVATWAYGSCAMAVNRDLACGDRDVLGFAPDKPADTTVAVGRVASPEGRLRAVLVNYACHPTTLAHENSLLSPDYIGATRDVVTGATGVPCLFFQGASGDLSPREQYGPGTADTDRHGRALGHAVLSTLENMGAPSTQLRFDGVVESGAPLGIWSEHPAQPSSSTAFHRSHVTLACQPVRTAEEVARRWARIDPVAAAERIARSERLAVGYREGATARHPFWVWQVGDAVVVAHPGEACSPLQTVLRERHPERVLFVLNLTNGPGFMYLPDAEAYDHDRYQTWQTLLARGCLEELIEATDSFIRELPPAREVQA
ncbi:hypothetical protein [Microbacterium sp.]|uniref:hypothetical protein n=1 Tax=Microbacterium sp. TaxID=51671 RepID=UPI0039E413A1